MLKMCWKLSIKCWMLNGIKCARPDFKWISSSFSMSARIRHKPVYVYIETWVKNILFSLYLELSPLLRSDSLENGSCSCKLHSDILTTLFYHHLCLATSLLRYSWKLNTCLMCITVFINQGMSPHPALLHCLILFILLFLGEKHKASHTHSLQYVAGHNYKWPGPQLLEHGLPWWCGLFQHMNRICVFVTDPSSKELSHSPITWNLNKIIRLSALML